MSRPLPVRLNPFRAAEQGRKISGEVSLKGMHRLAETIGETDASAHCEFEFFKKSVRDCRLRGRVTVNFNLRCERCLGLYSFELNSDFEVALVATDAEEQALIDEVEPYRVEDDNLEVVEFIEDEILLGLPTIPRHPDKKDCNVLVMREFEAETELDGEEPIEGKPNPFAVLESLKKH